MHSGDYKIKVLAVYKYLLETDRDHPLTVPEITDKLEREYNISPDRQTLYSDLAAIEIIDPRFRKKRGVTGRFNSYWIEKEV